MRDHVDEPVAMEFSPISWVPSGLHPFGWAAILSVGRVGAENLDSRSILRRRLNRHPSIDIRGSHAASPKRLYVLLLTMFQMVFCFVLYFFAKLRCVSQPAE